jgi:hypothetical protein
MIVDLKKLSTIELKALGWDQAKIRDQAASVVIAIEEDLARREFEALNTRQENEQNTDRGMGDDKALSDG